MFRKTDRKTNRKKDRRADGKKNRRAHIIDKLTALPWKETQCDRKTDRKTLERKIDR